jgi:hypothetical protein
MNMARKSRKDVNFDGVTTNGNVAAEEELQCLVEMFPDKRINLMFCIDKPPVVFTDPEKEYPFTLDGVRLLREDLVWQFKEEYMKKENIKL